jgi:hypothetical protein
MNALKDDGCDQYRHHQTKRGEAQRQITARRFQGSAIGEAEGEGEDRKHVRREYVPIINEVYLWQ